MSVLLVSDIGADRETAEVAFRGSSILHTVRDLSEAVKILKAEPVDCVVMEDRLFREGRDLLEHFRQNPEEWDRGIPIILLTACDAIDRIAEIKDQASFNGIVNCISRDDLSSTLLKHVVDSAVRFHKTEAAWAGQIQQLQNANLHLKEANARLEELACLDPLTEVLNRRGFQGVLSRECRQAQRDGQYFIVLLIDIDNFKQINDRMGYDAGDFILKEVAKRLRGKLRATDYVARIGGDEFMILLPRTRPTEGLEVAQKIRLAVSEAMLWRTGTIGVTLSIGLAMVTDPIRSINELLARTHIALVKSKSSGKNQVTFSTEEEEKRWQKKKLFAQGLDLLRQGEELLVFSQPIFRLDPLQIVGYEFFSRSPVSGFEMPEDFFHVASEANMLAFMDRICFEKSVQATQTYYDPALQYHINMFPTTLLALPVEDLLSVFPPDRPRERYCFEFSEKWFVGNLVDFVKGVHRLRAEGIKIAIDDVGFGQTFLESLILLAPDFIKIDSSCTNGIAQNEAKCRSLERLLKIVKTLGAGIMAKGVESGEDMAMLRKLGVPMGQGHFLALPVQLPDGRGERNPFVEA